jgi:hypothetical protein
MGKWHLPWLACKIFPYNNLNHTRCFLISLKVSLLARKFPAFLEFQGSFLCSQRFIYRTPSWTISVWLYLSHTFSLRPVSLSPCLHLSVLK